MDQFSGTASEFSPSGGSRQGHPPSAAARRCRKKFLRYFGDGFRDETFHAWERDYKVDAHEHWSEVLDPKSFRALLRKGEFSEIAKRAIGVESRTHLVFSFE